MLSVDGCVSRGLRRNISLEMEGNTGILKDNNGDTLTLVYDATEKCVYVKEREYVQI